MSFDLRSPSDAARPQLYEQIALQVGGLLQDERDPWANTANVSALLFAMLPQLNWAGFYLLRGGELVVGPFQGKPACVRIAMGRGVCGQAAAERHTLVVADVHAFADHIACDAASNSEIVVPLLQGGRLIGVLDLDSPELNRFNDEDAAGLERIAALVADGSDWALAGIDGF